MENLWRDLRSGVRLLLKAPGYTTTAVMVLALGIGANGAIFSVVRALLLEPTPFRDSHRLMMVYETRSSAFDREPVSTANFLEWRERGKVFEHVAAYLGWKTNITGVDDPERVNGLLVSPSLFQVVGATAMAGRTFSHDEERPGSHPVVILSHDFWQRRFGGSLQVVGARLELDGQGFAVVGVMPPDFDFGGTDLFAPLVLTPDRISNRETHDLEVLGRLKPEVSEAQAQAEMAVIAGVLAQQYPQANGGRGVNLIPLNKAVVGKFTSSLLFMLCGAVIFVLLIACANVGNLQMVRAIHREKEVAIRLALGAGRWRIVRQLLAEIFLLSFISAGVGALLTACSVHLIRTSIPTEVTRFIPGWKWIGVDGSVLGFIVLTSLLTVVISGLAPALQSSSLNPNLTLKGVGNNGGQSRGRNRLRRLLVVVQVALALVLLVSSALMVKGFRRLVAEQRQGFDPDRVLSMRLMLPARKYAAPHQMTAFYDRLIKELATIPGVEAAGLIRFLPSTGERRNSRFVIEGRPGADAREPPSADLQAISPNCLQVLRIPLLKGREFTEQDNAMSPPVTIISESLARRFFPDRDPIGQRIRLETPEVTAGWATIIGVAGNVRSSVFDREQRPLIYLPYSQLPDSTMCVILRASGDPLSLITVARQRVHSMDADQPLFQVKKMDRVIADAASGVRVASALMAVLGVVALILAAVGVYSVMAYSVTQRTREIGVRMALGAQRRDVIRLVLKHALKLTAVGLLIGAPVAFAFSRAMFSLLFGVAALDFLTFAGFTLALAAITVLASYLPVRRATKVDPLIALRCD